MYPWQATNAEELLKISPNWKSWDSDNKQVCYYVNSRTGEVEIEGYFQPNGIFHIEAHPTFVQQIFINYNGETYLPFQLDITHYPIDITALKITNFIGLPSKILGTFIVNDCTIKSMEGFPSELTQFNFNYLPIEYKLHNYLKKADSIYLGNKFNYKGFLSFMLIKNLQEVNTYSKYQMILDIVNKHLQADRDLLECQEELRAKGFKEYAKL